jgi:hypothetical protein
MPDEPDPTSEQSRPAVDGPADGPSDGSTDDDPATGESDDRPADAPPEAVVDEAARLTSLAREAVDEAEAVAYREDRAATLAEYDYVARVRQDDTGDVLVVHPAEWVEDGTIHPERIGDIDRGIERRLTGSGEGDDWEAIEAENRTLVEEVRTVHGEDHAANVAVLADFAGNHYAKPITSLTREELRTFLDDYYRRNAWPTDEQRALVEKSVVLSFQVADERCPIEPTR